MLPLLRLAADGREHKLVDVREALAKELDLSAADREERLPSGQQSKFVNRVAWAKVYLGQAGLLASSRRGHFQITDRGREVLNAPPTRIDINFLEQYPEFIEFRAPKGDGDGQRREQPLTQPDAEPETPEERNQKARLRWLLAFAHRALRTLDDVACAEREIGEFVAHILPMQGPLTPIESAFHGRTRGPGAPDPSTLVRNLQGELQAGLEALWECGVYRPREVPSMTQVLRLPTGVVIPVFSGSQTSRFHAAVMLLLYDVGWRLRSCPTCGAWFVKVRRWSYCTALCASRFQRRQWRATYPERVSELRHGAYERSVRRQPGKSDAQVKRRSRR
jgi:hypothetical protein